MWWSNRDSDHDIYHSFSIDNGNSWSTSHIFNSNGGGDTGSDLHPRIATDGLRKWLVVWSSNDTHGGTVGIDYDVYMSSFDFGEAISTVYVDFDLGMPNGVGAIYDPVDSIGDALDLVEVGGLIRINAGSSPETETIEMGVTLERNGSSGTVTLGTAAQSDALVFDFESGYVTRKKVIHPRLNESSGRLIGPE